MRSLSKITGGMLGLAIGDALGYPVAHLTRPQILEQYGQNGIQGFDLSNGFAIVSDDTQMAMFTANGLLLGRTRGCMRGVMGPYAGYLAIAYLDWCRTQHMPGQTDGYRPHTWLYGVEDLHHRRGPDPLCLHMLEARKIGTIETPEGRASSSCVLARAIPIGLFFDPAQMAQAEIDRLGAESAAITNGHPMGWLPAAVLVHIISRITYGDIKPKQLEGVVQEAVRACSAQFSGYPDEPMASLLRRAARLVHSGLSDAEALAKLGSGAAAEEVLAHAIYCCLKYPQDFEACIIAAVNHSGKSDAVGAVAGAISGALLGSEAIPAFFTDPLELRPELETLAQDLWGDCRMSAQSCYYDDD